MRARLHFSTLASIATSILILSIYIFRYEKREWIRPVKNDSTNASNPYRNVTDNLHLFIVAREANANVCRTILTAHVLGYPTPTLLLWNQTLDDPTTEIGSHPDGITAAAEYFRFFGDDKAHELALVVNGYDVWFQLPPAILIERYRLMHRDANEALLRRMGPAAKAFDIFQDIVFGANKRCAPNKPYSVACYAVPESPLPRDLYGNNTDTVIGYSKWSSLRQRYLDSGIAIGPISSMQLAFGHAEKKMADEVGHIAFRDTENISDQEIWNTIFGEQEFQREILRRKQMTPAALKADQQRLQRSMIEGTIIDDLINPSFTHETMEHGAGREYEYGLGLDYWSKLVQQTSDADGDAKFLYHNGSDILRQLGKPSAFECPSRVKGRLPDDIMRADLHGTRIPSQQMSWSDVSLYTNICLDTIPVVIHHNGARPALEHMWKELWINCLSGFSLRDEVLRDPDRTFATANSQALTWRGICPAELDDEVFGGSEGTQTTECSTEDIFVLGEGTEQVEYSSEGSRWLFQVFKSSTLRPPVMKIKQDSDATLAQGLIFITLYKTKAHGVKMPGPMIFTDQGRLIWFGPIGNAANFKVQQLDGKPTLLFWMRDGPVVKGHGYGNIVLLGQDYSEQTVLCPRYGLNTANFAKPNCEADLHEAHIVSSRNTILTTAYNATPADLSSIQGPADGWLWDCQFYELDPVNKTVLFQWRAIDHVPLSESRHPIRGHGSSAYPYDFFHINSVVDVGDHYLVSSRHCWTIYLIDKQGNIVWRFSGDGNGDFGHLPLEAHFRWQHDARPHNIGHDYIDISLFDNENWDVYQEEPKEAAKLLVFRLPMRPNRGSKKSQVQVIDIVRPQADYQSVSQGAFDSALPDGNKLATWGDIPIVTEFDGSGREIWSAQFGPMKEAHIYRGFKQEWHATPYTQPTLFVEKNPARRTYDGYVSWNGATDVEYWNIYAGLTTDSVTHLGRVENKGFETKFNLPCWTRLAQVGAVTKAEEVRRSKFFQVS